MAETQGYDTIYHFLHIIKLVCTPNPPCRDLHTQPKIAPKFPNFSLASGALLQRRRVKILIFYLGDFGRYSRSPKMVLPILMLVLPIETASSKSLDIPIDNSKVSSSTHSISAISLK
jgi:hypothetical protein